MVGVEVGLRLGIRACCELHESELKRLFKEVGHIDMVYVFSMKL